MQDYREYFIISAEPEMVYKALTTEKTIRLWTGSPATFKDEVGAEFEFYDGTLAGQNLLLSPSDEIIQQWYLAEIDKAEDASIVTMKLFEHKKGTSLLLTQTNIPKDMFENITDGWKNQFMKDLAVFYIE